MKVMDRLIRHLKNGGATFMTMEQAASEAIREGSSRDG